MRLDVVLSALMTALLASSVNAMAFCSAYRGGYNYETAKTTYPELADRINTVQDQGLTPWYTDNSPKDSLEKVITNLSSKCGTNTKIPMVVYGIPNKDCEAGYSNLGFNKNFDDYKAFIQRLNKEFPNQHMIYIVEPDALGLLVNGGCAVKHEYKKYVQYVLETLSTNPNAELYLDIGSWIISGNPDAAAKVVNEVWPKNSKLKGISLNVSNYKKTDDMLALCDQFATRTGRKDMKCIVDTSRNYRETPNGQWCNVKGAGLGVPPTQNTGKARAAYYMWVKTPGLSDGECTHENREQSMLGPRAGNFFKEYFEMLWKNGYLADKKATPSPPPKPAKPTETPAPEPSTAKPTETPAPSSAEPTSAPEPSTSSPAVAKTTMTTDSYVYCGTHPDKLALNAWCKQNCPSFCPEDLCQLNSCN
ncbi:hypothetical protein Poli38472_012557 [Pythium oligandrum]|uniref:Glucanase n=1 Tax=Pythium oligandrum TaxID=41045 RepID=A0A8K1FG83_PYTOL|nr:hypothetical protein Poli38472_012557 [Pythium oligandrum]|eukprot:TMW61366.1 hypothetical protein Poli38472_012557 [Pythium oligandrum]